MKKTDWYPADVLPVHEGVYEVRRWTAGGEKEMPPHRLRWSDGQWKYIADAFGRGMGGKFACMAARDGDCWRGLTEPQS